MPARVSPVEGIRARIDELFASQQELGKVLEEVARLAVRLVMQAALEAEVSEFLGHDRYVRDERARAGYRNGYAELTVKTTAGPVVLERPKPRGTHQAFASRLLGKGVSRTNALESLVLSGFVRGLSVRDVEAIAHADHGNGPEPAAPRRRAEKDPDTRAVEQALEDVLGLVVTIHHRGQSGEMRIRYKTLEQLDGLCRRLRDSAAR